MSTVNYYRSIETVLVAQELGLMIYCQSNVEFCKTLENGSVDLTVTSPPYDNLRSYEGLEWDFEALASELWRVTAKGGVVVWIVADATVDGSETGSSFRQALHFMSLGFKLNDTMIWDKGGFSAVGSLAVRYGPVFEYMFVFSKGKPKTFNPIKDRANKNAGLQLSGTKRQKDGTTKRFSESTLNHIVPEFGQRFNIWTQFPQRQRGGHPAPFPEQLAADHIVSWSNPGDLVFDPFLGSGTTGVAALKNDRRFIGCDISQKYCDMALDRIESFL